MVASVREQSADYPDRLKNGAVHALPWHLEAEAQEGEARELTITTHSGRNSHVRLVGELHDLRIEKIEDVLRVGDRVVVKVNEIDDRGRINLTMKGVTAEEKAPLLADDVVNPE